MVSPWHFRRRWRPTRSTGPLIERDAAQRPANRAQTQVPSVSMQSMRNTGNTCYINSTVFSLLWQAQQRVDVTVPETWQRVQQGGNWAPANFLRFQMIGWSQPQDQRDVVEFLQFLLPHLVWTGEPSEPLHMGCALANGRRV